MQKFAIKASAAAALMALAGYASAAALSVTSASVATESYQATSVYALPQAVYTLGVSVTQDWYITFTLNNGATFSTAPTATVSSVGGTATPVAGGVGQNKVTFRINGSAATNASGDTVTLDAGATVATLSAAADTTITATNGLLFISGEVASPLEAAPEAKNLLTFAENWGVTVGAADKKSGINVSPTPISNSRKVFVNVVGGDSDTRAVFPISITNSAKRAANHLTEDFATGSGTTSLDTLTLTLNATSGSLGQVSAICFAPVAQTACSDGGALAFAISGNQATLTLTGANLAALASKNIILEKAADTVFTPMALALSHKLDVTAGDSTRTGMTAHTHTYANASGNTWGFEYRNGAVLNASLVKPGYILRLTNKSANSMAVISAVSFNTNNQANLTSFPAEVPKRGAIQYTARNGVMTQSEITLGGNCADIQAHTLPVNETTGVVTEITMTCTGSPS